MSDDELGGLTKLVNIPLLVDPVGLLIVDEHVSGAIATHPLFVNIFVRFLFERLLLKIQISHFRYITEGCAPDFRAPRYAKKLQKKF